jgi:cupin fold WbuC family metalloprotein
MLNKIIPMQYDDLILSSLEEKLVHADKRAEYTDLGINELIKYVSSLELPELISAAGEINGRGQFRNRAIKTVHRLNDDNTSDSKMNVMLSSFLKGTYVAPHRHGGGLSKPKEEFFLLMHGSLAIVFHNDKGELERVAVLNKDNNFIKISPNTWHGVVCLTESAGMLEFKDGPYVEANDKQFLGELTPGKVPLEQYDEDGKLSKEASVFVEKLEEIIQGSN